MQILKFTGGYKIFRNLGKSFVYAETKSPRLYRRFSNSNYARLQAIGDSELFRNYYHKLFLTGEDVSYRSTFPGIFEDRTISRAFFKAHVVQIDLNDIGVTQRRLDTKVSAKYIPKDIWDWTGHAIDLRLLEMDGGGITTHVEKMIKAKRDEYFKKFRVLRRGQRRRLGVISPFYIMQYRGRGIVDVMFFIGGEFNGTRY